MYLIQCTHTHLHSEYFEASAIAFNFSESFLSYILFPKRPCFRFCLYAWGAMSVCVFVAISDLLYPNTLSLPCIFFLSLFATLLTEHPEFQIAFFSSAFLLSALHLPSTVLTLSPFFVVFFPSS